MNIKEILQKNVVILSITLIISVIFLFVGKFSLINIFIVLVNITFLYLFVFKNNNTLLVFSLIYTVSFIFFSLPSYASSIFISSSIFALSYFIVFKSLDNNIKIIYSLLFTILSFEIITLINIFTLLSSAKSIIIFLCMYLLLNFALLKNSEKLDIIEIVKHSLIFSISMVLLFLNINLFIS